MKYETEYLTASNIYDIVDKKNRSYSDYRLVQIIKIMNEYVAIIEKREK